MKNEVAVRVTGKNLVFGIQTTKIWENASEHYTY